MVGCFETTAPFDAAVDGGRDAGATTPPECVIEGYARCDGECSGTCPDRGDIYCGEHVPLCVSFNGDDDPYSCAESRTSQDVWQQRCPSGQPCVGVERDSATIGNCLEPATCLELRRTGHPELLCTYTDRTELVEGPPAAVCPEPVHPVAPFCGGACGPDRCPLTIDSSELWGHCIGLSDTRGFGVCTFQEHSYEVGTELRFTACEEWYDGQPCALIAFDPRPTLAREDFGFPVLREACLRYDAVYRENVRCYDGAGNRIDPEL